jgi:hypothetical protein
MTRWGVLALSVALIATAGCAGKGAQVKGDEPPPPAACNAVRNAAEINTILQSAEQSARFLKANAVRLTTIGAETAGAAANEARAQDKIRCYGLSLRAYGALLRNPGSEAAALSGASAPALDGEGVCAAQTASLDAGMLMDCARVRVWRHTLATLTATQEIETLAPPERSLTPEAWPAIKAQMQRIGENVADDWGKTDNVQEARGHRLRTGCRYYAQSTRVRGQFGLLSPIMGEYNPLNGRIIAALTDATPVSAQEAGCVASEAAETCAEKRQKAFIEACRALSQGS